MTDQKTGTDLEHDIDAATEAVEVQVGKLETLAASARGGDPIGLGNLLPIPVRVAVEIGRTRITLAELVKLAPGSLLTLDRDAHEPVDILVNGKIVARGEVVTVGEQYGVRVTDVLKS
jgi:flagellar motor switch protein FliN/FliY